MVDYERFLRDKLYPQKAKPPVKKYIGIVLASIGGLFLLFFLIILGYSMYLRSQFVTYHDDLYKFSIQYFKTWTVVAHPKPTVAVEFIRPKETSLETIRENFNVTVQPLPQGIYSLEELSNTLKAQMISVFGNRIIEYKRVHWGWRQGYWMSVAVVKPDHYRLVNVWLVANNKVYILTFLGSIINYRNDAVFVEKMVRSFHLL